MSLKQLLQPKLQQKRYHYLNKIRASALFFCSKLKNGWPVKGEGGVEFIMDKKDVIRFMGRFPDKKEHIIEARCRKCHLTFDIAVDLDHFKAWQEGALIQDAMPYLTPEERELFISELCPDCWDKMFKEE